MRTGIIGASGYTGADLMRILYAHPEAEVTYITAHAHAGDEVTSLYPHLQRYRGMRFSSFDPEEALEAAEVYFVALPHGEPMAVVPELLDGGSKVIDLSADYRLSSPESYRQWYGLEHSSPHLLGEAAYGLPELYGEGIAKAKLIAVPGCYPTAAMLALSPLARAGLKGLDGAIIDAKSGLTGAGRSLSLATHYAQANENAKPYGVGAHRHTPEIEQVLSAIYGAEIRVVFTPHLVPMSRGILATCYLRVGKELGPDQIEALYGEFYGGCPFVVLLGAGVFPETKAVAGSNYCHIGWHLDGTRGVLTVASAIDNLVKGASGQAVQCMNVMHGWEETMGLDAMGLFP